MTTKEQVAVIKKYIKFLNDNKEKWISSGKVNGIDVEYDIECLKQTINTITELNEFLIKIYSMKKDIV